MAHSQLQFYIHGKQVNSKSLPTESDASVNLFGQNSQTFENYCPATGEKLGDVQSANVLDVDAAVKSAQQGFQKWSMMTGAQRGRILMKAAQLVRDRVKELAQLEVMDNGKPISEALNSDIPSSADCIEYYAGVAATIHGQNFNLGDSAFAYTRREPLGVCAGIGAWNFPFQIACWKSAPALACGNAMVFKPSELTPLTAMKLAEIYTEAGVPDGVFNVIHGNAKTGQILCEHPDIAKISLTGSVPTGKKVMESASHSLKHVTLELGGKSPLLLFSDTNVDKAVTAAMMANFYTQGEVCCNGTRVFVQESLYDEFLDRLIARTNALRVGDPFDPSTQVGALISRAHREKVLHYIRLGIAEGAKLLCGGNVPESPGGGYFLRPAVFANCADSMTFVKDEIFGPVMTVLKFKTEEEVLERANQSPYGLAAGIFTENLNRAHRFAAKLQTGMCWINTYNVFPIEIPFGGYKQSGIGRENGLAVIDHYTQLKSVYVNMGGITF